MSVTSDGRWLYPSTPVSPINKTDRHDITEVFLKVALNTINQTNLKYCENIENLEYKNAFWNLLLWKQYTNESNNNVDI